MRKYDDKRNASNGFALSVGIGTASGFLVILILFAILAALIASGKISDDLMVYITAFAAFVGAMIGAIVAVKRLKGKVMTVSLCVGSLMFLLTLIGSAFSKSGDVFGKLTPSLLIAFLLGSIIGGFLKVKRTKNKRA
ncbi:MAG: TIGR04086 family membrane protein [Clostridiales bacterium]|nr:TIGR04086 family membrane protein [Clostridiales bacterium]